MKPSNGKIFVKCMVVGVGDPTFAHPPPKANNHTSNKGEITVKGAKGARVKVFFQGLCMTCVILALVYNLKFCILDTPFSITFEI
jgi:hypothetical protein